MGEERLPYPAIAIADLANNYSPGHFRFAIKQCRDVLGRLTAEDNSSDQQIARVRILRHLDVQLERAARWIDQDADVMAWVLRSLIELKFWAHFVSDSMDNANRFLHEQSIDARELYEGLEKLVPAGIYKLEVPLPGGKRVPVEPSGETESLIWKMCSKLIHPTSCVINNPEETIHNRFQRQVWSIYVLYYGWGIIN